jgi:hypothetical protein
MESSHVDCCFLISLAAKDGNAKGADVPEISRFPIAACEKIRFSLPLDCSM